MSRIGKIPVSIPKEVKAMIESGTVNLQGPKGKLSLDIPFGIKVEQKEENLVVTRNSNSKQDRANHGTIRSRLVNIVEGLTKGHKKDLEIQGLGFRCELKETKLVFNLGLSHPVQYEIPSDVTVTAPSQVAISVEGTDKVRVGQIAAKIRALKPAEPYKGKGIRYVGEVIRRKQGKSVTK